MVNPNKTDWGKIKTEYMANPTMSLKKLAEKNKLSYSYLQQVSAKEKWVAQKKEILKNATESALEEVEGSLKKIIIRHAKVARWLQNAGLSRLQKRVAMVVEREKLVTLGTKKSLLKALTIKEIEDRLLLAMVAEGLKAERDLYPKQLQVEGGLGIDVEVKGISEALDKALYEVFRKNLGRKRPSIHNGRKNKNKVRSKSRIKK